jgi:hypothetical protein
VRDGVGAFRGSGVVARKHRRGRRWYVLWPDNSAEGEEREGRVCLIVPDSGGMATKMASRLFGESKSCLVLSCRAFM